MPIFLGTKEGSRSFTDEVARIGGSTVESSKSELTYFVLGDTINDTKQDILDVSEVPNLSSVINGEKVISVVPKERQTVIHPTTLEKTYLWEIAVKTDSAFDASGGGGGGGGGITQFRPVTRWSSETIEERVWVDVETGEGIETVPGDAILVSKRRHIPVLEIKRYEEYPFDPDLQLRIPEHTNLRDFWGAPPGSALCDSIQVEEQAIQGTIFVWVTYIFKFKLLEDGIIINGIVKTTDGWDFLPSHRGTSHFDLVDGEISEKTFTATDLDGNPKTVPLNTDGTIKEKVAGGVAANVPDRLSFQIYHKVDFDFLSLNFQDVITMQPG